MSAASLASSAALAGLAAATGVPAIYGERSFVAAGGLMSYGAEGTSQFRRAAEFVDRIARGARPADLPVEQPTEFELVINAPAARQLGLTPPSSLLVQASDATQ